MALHDKDKGRFVQTKFSFGMTSAIITNLGLITGLNTAAHAKLAIIGSMLVIALADNIADSFGIHIYQESECLNEKEVWFSTFTNFFTRLFVSLSFIILIFALPLKLAVAVSVAWGLGLLAMLSYIIAKSRGMTPAKSMLEHISIAVFVIIASSLVGSWFIGKF